jgi:hypothetical protein
MSPREGRREAFFGPPSRFVAGARRPQPTIAPSTASASGTAIDCVHPGFALITHTMPSAAPFIAWMVDQSGEPVMTARRSAGITPWFSSAARRSSPILRPTTSGSPIIRRAAAMMPTITHGVVKLHSSWLM